jgi:hypothetical protein
MSTAYGTVSNGIFVIFCSVACLSRIPNPGSEFFHPIPDPGSKIFRTPDLDPHQRIHVFLTLKLFLSSRENNMGCSSRIRISFHHGSRIRIQVSKSIGVKKIPDPDTHLRTQVFLTLKTVSKLSEN